LRKVFEAISEFGLFHSFKLKGAAPELFQIDCD
jgi:hypothetical protein